MSGDRYVIAVKSDQRDDVPAGWKDIVRGTPGVTVLGADSPWRMQLRAPGEAIEQLRSALGRYLYIEKAVRHDF